jgi:hypothetical protein
MTEYDDFTGDFIRDFSELCSRGARVATDSHLFFLKDQRGFQWAIIAKDIDEAEESVKVTAEVIDE